MKKILGILLVLLTSISLFSCMDVQGQETVYTDEMLDDFIDFNLLTVNEIATEDNFLFSPFSLYYALSILYAFASDTAETELSTLYNLTKEDLLDQIEMLKNKLPVSDINTDFAMANLVYYDNSNNDYLVDGLSQYQTVFPYDLEEVNFPSGDAAKMLVEKIAEVTDGFLTPSEASFEFLKLATFLINNTIYYRGTWLNVYNENATQNKTFHSLGGIDQTVSMMTKMDYSSYYYESESATAVQNFFKDGSSMIFILPDESLSIKDLLNDHNEMKKLLQPDTYYESETIRITIPKFTFQNTFYLKDHLKNLGVLSIWDPTFTNFSLISDKEFFIQNVSQVSKIQIDEVGVKVAASTTIYGTTTSVITEYIEFNVDRPFLYVILSPENIPLFFGAQVSF